jgi:hypothetical protein
MNKALKKGGVISIFPVTWAHIILQGRFEFKKHEETLDINTIIKELDDSER